MVAHIIIFWETMTFGKKIGCLTVELWTFTYKDFPQDASFSRSRCSPLSGHYTRNIFQSVTRTHWDAVQKPTARTQRSVDSFRLLAREPLATGAGGAARLGRSPNSSRQVALRVALRQVLGRSARTVWIVRSSRWFHPRLGLCDN